MQTARRCHDVQQDLCRLAVGGQPAERGEPGETVETVETLARHARGCTGCRDFADDLAGVSHWLDVNTPTPRPCRIGSGEARRTRPADEPLVARACEALERELSARLARDLLELGQGRPDRDPSLRRLDLSRLMVLRGADVLRRPPWRGAVRLLSRRRRAIDRRRALRLAMQLDPMGLDVALVYLAQLDKDGRRREADAEADRLLGRLQ
jgi:hypothetical protein